mmetsp:Transcript_95690/g.298434  ORF Transcript_95690/g.298434 Transcript_95690/m.298434 type:complete len:182 (+) Transcript_95690:51-596(+)
MRAQGCRRAGVPAASWPRRPRRCAARPAVIALLLGLLVTFVAVCLTNFAWVRRLRSRRSSDHQMAELLAKGAGRHQEVMRVIEAAKANATRDAEAMGKEMLRSIEEAASNARRELGIQSMVDQLQVRMFALEVILKMNVFFMAFATAMLIALWLKVSALERAVARLSVGVPGSAQPALASQ